MNYVGIFLGKCDQDPKMSDVSDAAFETHVPSCLKQDEASLTEKSNVGDFLNEDHLG